MVEDTESNKPIIIKRVRKSRSSAHGGSWKVAFADFATAMMAFFLLLWLIGNTTEPEKQAISGYFNDPTGKQNKVSVSASVIGEGGANSAVINMKAVQAETAEVEKEEPTEEDIKRLIEEKEIAQLELLKENLESLINTSEAFRLFKDQVIVDIIPSGLRIQIVDKDKRPMFDSGSAEPKFYSKKILHRLASVLKKVPNKLSITGHTDATPYVARDDYGNWELSADRANSARRELLYGGFEEKKVARVEGFASSILFDKSHPHNPINRRIAIIVLKKSVVEEIEKQVLGIE
ncbi:flagellar motor protein MotB [Aliikangiella sp. IMCC44359]|uniref:flagellar motor protein MotB n=1 Tax=Aliikangiella sp. IMCC44359 TaxID=3459125 RepID=UPI00403AD076